MALPMAPIPATAGQLAVVLQAKILIVPGGGAHDSTDPGGGGGRSSSKRDHAMNQKTKQKQKSREAIAASGRRTPS